MTLTGIGNVFYDLNDFPRAINFYHEAARINKILKSKPGTAFWFFQTEVNLGTAFMLNNQLDSAFSHLGKSYEETLYDDYWNPVFLMFFGQLQFRLGRHDAGLHFLRKSVRLFENNKDPYSTSDACRIIASCFGQINQVDSSIYYSRKSLDEARKIGYKTTMLLASKQLAEAYESKDIEEALYYRKVYDSTNDILYGPEKVRSLQKTISEEQERQRKVAAESLAYQNRLKQYGFLAGLTIVLLIAFILYRNNRQKQKANEVLSSALSNLKTTQALLIQSEKMASLGELTAGIAHEIQNPLNFVNNFSEVNKELLTELNEEIEKGNLGEAKTIVADIAGNEDKISHHGKRADSIVKGMLQHSRSTSTIREPTDINALADEYLRLAFHGLRAKDKSFNAAMKTDFDRTNGTINLIPQDIGRVLLNLFNNAFYAVNEKIKSGVANYEPVVSISTKCIKSLAGVQGVEVKVMDNGTGMPQRVLDKIFQPFFTTKPTGSGTGLGLSLAYDIVKAHGGEIKVESEEGVGTQFIIKLPAEPGFIG
jgi:signal transduction histidine kinase